MGLSRANNTATVSGADVVRRLRDRFLGSKRRLRSSFASRRHPIWPESAEFGMARDFLACLVFPDYSEFSKSQVLDDDYGSTWRHIDHLADN